jgi:putative colanic acid biosynthesis acetyltransferase WcaF
MNLDIASARSARPYSLREYLGRIAWMCAYPAFRFSPRILFGWRRLLLRLFGARVGRRVNIYPSARIELPWNLDIGDEASIGERVLVYNLGKVSIGPRATVSHNAHLCAGTHDYKDPRLPLLREPIEIGADAWVCASAFVGPGSRVGEGAVVGAASVCNGEVEAWTVVSGNPAVFRKRRELREDPAT